MCTHGRYIFFFLIVGVAVRVERVLHSRRDIDTDDFSRRREAVSRQVAVLCSSARSPPLKITAQHVRTTAAFRIDAPLADGVRPCAAAWSSGSPGCCPA